MGLDAVQLPILRMETANRLYVKSVGAEELLIQIWLVASVLDSKGILSDKESECQPQPCKHRILEVVSTGTICFLCQKR